jgi:hypothetical protein
MYPFPDLSIIKLHELNRTGTHGDAILQEMFCHLVDKDSMPHSCAAVQLDETVKIGELAINPYYSFNYDMLATAAYEKQLFGFQKTTTKKTITNANTTTTTTTQKASQPTRRDIANLLQLYQESVLHLKHYDFDSICLDKNDMDWILNISITNEKKYYNDWTSQYEDNLRQAFMTYSNERSYVYCWINTETTLQDPRWLSFLGHIH